MGDVMSENPPEGEAARDGDAGREGDVIGRAEAEARLALLGREPDAALDLAEAALLLAALDRPRVGLERYRAHLGELARLVGEPPAPTLEARAQALNRAIRERLGYDGDSQTYDDPQNANLLRVIDRRRGIPVTLAILYLHGARAQGWEAHALRFPGHVLIRLDAGPRRLILDPFNAGQVLDAAGLRALVKSIGGGEAELTPEHTLPLTNREVLLRLQNNIKLRRIQANRLEEGLATLESMLLLAPADWSLWAEAAALHQRLENLGAAALALGQVIALAPSPALREEAERQRSLLRQRLN
jgi:regulator of sirC expression with transglutaminase-like and TPR domain